MGIRTPLNVSKTERTELERVARRPSTPQALARRCRVVLLDEEDLTMTRASCSGTSSGRSCSS